MSIKIDLMLIFPLVIKKNQIIDELDVSRPLQYVFGFVSPFHVFNGNSFQLLDLLFILKERIKTRMKEKITKKKL